MLPALKVDAERIAATAERELAALVGVSTPSGDKAAAEEALAIVAALLPSEATIERVPCSTEDHADDLIATVHGTGSARVLLVGHVDTVVAHDAHEPLRVEGDRLIGSGAIDMKGGDVLALGVMRTLARRRADFAEAALLLVCDEEWRLGEFRHTARFAGFDACLCFEAGELDDQGRDAVVLRRKAAGTLKISATGKPAHSGSSPEDGINALLALASVAETVAACSDPHGPDRLTAVPTVMRAGNALNVVPARAELICDVRASSLDAIDRVLAAVPEQVHGATISAENLRRWPGMDHRASMRPLLGVASAALGREIVGAARGGASDASHFSSQIPLCVDGLGPVGGLAHAPGEHLLRASILSRAEVALAITDAVLASSGGDVLYTAAQS